MRTYTFGRCIELLDIDPKIFRRWVKADLGLSEKDQISRSDSRVRFLTHEQLEKLAGLHDKTLPTDDGQADGEEEHTSPGSYKLLTDRLDTLEKSAEEATHAISSLKSEMSHWDTLEHRVAEIEKWLQTQRQSHDIQEEEAAPRDQRIEEIEARYQERIAELERELATYKQQQRTPPPKRPSTRKKKKAPPRRTLPSTLVARNTFALQHNVSDKLVSKASLDGKMATVEGKWYSQDHLVTRALNPRGRYDFYQLFHQRPDFKSCEECPHALPTST